MKKFAAIALLFLAVATSACTRINPGYVGITVKAGGSDRGVQDFPATTGWVFYNPMSTTVIEYPTFVQTAIWTKNPNEGDSDCEKCDESITFTNLDQMPINADISLSYHLKPEMVPAFYVKFRAAQLRHFTHTYLRNIARDAFNEHAGKYSIAQIMGDNAVFLKDVRDNIQSQLTPVGVELDQFGIVGAPRPPVFVSEAINSKAHANQLAQQKQNELVQVQADAAKVVAKATGDAEATRIWAEAQANANRRMGESITSNLLELKRLEKWDGHLPQFNGGSTNPFVSLDRK